VIVQPQRIFLLSFFLVACSSDATTGDDAGTDGTVADAPNETTTTTDAAKEASSDGGGIDAPADAIDDTIDDGSSSDAVADAPQDASVDADDSGVIDAGSLDAGKGCLGVFCIIGDTCCNNVASVNYGKCEPNSCKTCCK
jgi:hypothetical protein